MVHLSPTALIVLATVVFCCAPPHAAADERPAPLVEQYLTSGRLAEGDEVLTKQLKAQPQDDQARFGLGVLRFARAVEHLAQSLYQYGLVDHSQNLPVPLLRMPLPNNPQPSTLSYARSREILETFITELAHAEATLAEIQAAEVKLPLHFGRIRLDLNGDGRADEQETLWRIYARVNRRANVTQAAAEEFLIGFDKADVFWLRGYCHLLMAISEVVLAHDGRDLFDRTGHVFFADVETPYEFLKRGPRVFNVGSLDVADLIALIHLINLPVVEASRMRVALEHLESVIALSRQSWKQLLAETDDDHEWIPSPRQTGVIPNVQITPEMVNGWSQFLDEAEAILQGKKLVPFWRTIDGRGINLRRVFTEPRTFDLVLWVQGTAAQPYLEEGPLSTPDVWARFNRLFQGEFLGFAIWFN